MWSLGISQVTVGQVTRAEVTPANNQFPLWQPHLPASCFVPLNCLSDCQPVPQAFPPPVWGGCPGGLAQLLRSSQAEVLPAVPWPCRDATAPVNHQELRHTQCDMDRAMHAENHNIPTTSSSISNYLILKRWQQYTFPSSPNTGALLLYTDRVEGVFSSTCIN